MQTFYFNFQCGDPALDIQRVEDENVMSGTYTYWNYHSFHSRVWFPLVQSFLLQMISPSPFGLLQSASKISSCGVVASVELLCAHGISTSSLQRAQVISYSNGRLFGLESQARILAFQYSSFRESV